MQYFKVVILSSFDIFMSLEKKTVETGNTLLQRSGTPERKSRKRICYISELFDVSFQNTFQITNLNVCKNQLKYI